MSVRVVTRREPWWLHNVAASREIERAALAGSAAHALMQSAGTAVARLALAITPHARLVRVMAGPGNNGGDGLVAASWLHRAGCGVEAVLCADAASLTGDARWAYEQALAAGVPIVAEATRRQVDLHIDALLGLGASRAVTGRLADAVTAMATAPVLSIDLPTGLDADSGNPTGAVVQATHTLALLTLKPGLFTARGRDLAGEVWFDDLGVTAPTASACAQLAPHQPAPARAHASHKGTYGDVAVVGGAPGMTGAAWLAAHAALAAGAGRVYCSLLDDAAPRLLPARPELMARRALWHVAPSWLAGRTVVCGCGGGEAVHAALAPLLEHALRIVLDADALNAIAHDTALQALVRQRGQRERPTVLTPHPLEAARLLGTNAADVQSQRLKAAQDLADRWSAVIVLKGSGSVVAAPGRLPSINPTGNAALATAGTGDVLAGWIAGAWGADPRPAMDVVVAAVVHHGEAADRYLKRGGRGPLMASELIDAMREIA